MIILRILAQILIAAALMSLGADALASLQEGEVTLRSLADFADLLRLGDPEKALRRWDGGGVVRDGLLYIVRLPAWVVLGLLGVTLAWSVSPRS